MDEETKELLTKCEANAMEIIALRRKREECDNRIKLLGRETANIMVQTGRMSVTLKKASVKLNYYRNFQNWDYIRSLPGYEKRKAVEKIRVVPWVTVKER